MRKERVETLTSFTDTHGNRHAKGDTWDCPADEIGRYTSQGYIKRAPKRTTTRATKAKKAGIEDKSAAPGEDKA